MKTVGVHHITIRVQDQAAARRFYEDVVGLSFMEIPLPGEITQSWRGSPREGAFAATQAGATYIVFAPPLEGTEDEDRFSEYRIGVDHLALAVENRSELEALVQRLRSADVGTEGIETDPVLGKEYVAFRDPDNIQWEAYMV